MSSLTWCSNRAAVEVLENQMIPKHVVAEHESALQHIVDTLKTHFPRMDIHAVGHRVVHGGPVTLIR